MILLDTDILIDFIRGFPASRAWFAAQNDTLAIPGFVAMELYAGCTNKADQQRIRREIAGIVILWPAEAATTAILPIHADGHLTHALGIIDALIAATALAHGLPLHTFNQKHFAAVPQLQIIRPYAR